MSPSPLSEYLDERTLSERLERAVPIFGREEPSAHFSTSDWMSGLSDNTKIVDLNLPGTHNSATWGYSDARQAELVKYTGSIRAPVFYRCQERSISQSLHDGIRVLDLRLGYNAATGTIGLVHGPAMLASTTTLHDVFCSLYNWIFAHPTETVLVFIYQQLQNSEDDRKFEEIVFDTLNDGLAKRFWLQRAGELGTLGEARGKLILLQRFTYQFRSAPSHHFGVYFDPEQWTPNGKDVQLIFNAEPKRLAYIQVSMQVPFCTRLMKHVEDNFHPLVSCNSGAEPNIASKFKVTIEHLEKYMDAPLQAEVAAEALYVSFASAHAKYDEVAVTPDMIALGDAATRGMNERLLAFFGQHKGKRFGIVLLDFYHSQPGLVQAIIGL
ncbi:PLC-like phosphodiesterase [Mycena sanguinolenta]|uniref:PLC-like phosphodiesterase n=1 Tax=Mycena sanguinolenta TaxID=230812 RepID=A0A8H7DB47_9AGAR|nr:PLC-like phosphodiesterase [Mycena sanguinolenta]